MFLGRVRSSVPFISLECEHCSLKAVGGGAEIYSFLHVINHVLKTKHLFVFKNNCQSHYDCLITKIVEFPFQIFHNVSKKGQISIIKTLNLFFGLDRLSN